MYQSLFLLWVSLRPSRLTPQLQRTPIESDKELRTGLGPEPLRPPYELPIRAVSTRSARDREQVAGTSDIIVGPPCGYVASIPRCKIYTIPIGCMPHCAMASSIRFSAGASYFRRRAVLTARLVYTPTLKLAHRVYRPYTSRTYHYRCRYSFNKLTEKAVVPLTRK